MNDYIESISKNCAKWIKYAAIILFVLSVIGSVILGFIISATAPDTDSPQAIFGILFIFVGPIASFFPSLLTFGLGCVIENTDRIPLSNNVKE